MRSRSTTSSPTSLRTRRTRRSWLPKRCVRRLPTVSANADRHWRTPSLATARRSPKALARSWSSWLASICRELLEYCLRGEPWPDQLLDQALAVDDGRALLSIVVERLG